VRLEKEVGFYPFAMKDVILNIIRGSGPSKMLIYGSSIASLNILG